MELVGAHHPHVNDVLGGGGGGFAWEEVGAQRGVG